ncbi:MAG: tRNA (adenosine(37)-N6)-threonylcarbamoyltransferase complex transferase subunit TsaD [Phycisphaerales bacterium]
MLVLGIESSCDETAAAVVEDATRVRSSVVASQYELHAEYGGVVPEIASRAHERRILPVLRRAVADAGVTLADVDAVAVGHRPGLIGSLLVGLAAAKALAWSLDKPLVGVDHVHAHLHAAALGRDDQPAFPALGLVVSGGHSTIYRCASPTKLERLGATIDDAVGEAFDKAAAILGLGHPGGPAIDKLARSPDANDRAFDFPISRLAPDSLDLSFSGLKTAVLYEVNGRPQPRQVPGKPEVRVEPAAPMTDERRRDIAASFQRAAVRAVLIKLERALEQRGPFVSLIVGGGVSANSRLRAELDAFARTHDLDLRLPELRYCVDNAAMIAGLGCLLLAEGKRDDLTLAAVPTTAC